MAIELTKSHGIDFGSGVGTCSYNGVVFPNQIHAKATCKPVYDTANRRVKYVEYTFTIEFIFVEETYTLDGDDTPDDVFQEIRKLLTQNSRPFVFEGKGFDDSFSVNTKHQDVIWGPRPTMLTWEPIGGNRAIRCVWECVVTVAECENGYPTKKGILAEINFNMSWGIDAEGMTRRTINGTYELPMNFGDQEFRNQTLTQTADSLRHKIKIPVPLGFKRANQNWSISDDKRIMNFTIVDSEIASDNPYFPGILRINAPYRVVNTNRSFALWNVTLSADIELPRGTPRWMSWFAFLILVQDKKRFETNAKRGGKQTQGGIILINRISIEEDIYSRSFSFSMNWLLSANLATILQASGMFHHTERENWDEWSMSMTKLTDGWSNRGSAQMKHTPSDDVIVDLCTGRDSTTINNHVKRPTKPGWMAKMIKSECPPPKQSWLAFKNSIELVTESNTVTHAPMTSSVTPSSSSGNGPPPEDSEGTIPGTPDSYYKKITQYLRPKTYKIRMRGYAMRVCYEIPQVELRTYAGKKVKLVGEHKQLDRQLAGFNLPVHASTWDVTYEIEGTPPKKEYPIKQENYEGKADESR